MVQYLNLVLVLVLVLFLSLNLHLQKSSSSLSQYWCELTENKNEWEKYVENNLTIARQATLIQKQSGGLTPWGLALVDAQEQVLAKRLAAGVEAADRIQLSAT